MNIDFPFHFSETRQTAQTSEADHLRDMIEQLLFTTPGERVNRPDFGCGLRQAVFAPNSPELAAALGYTARAALQRFLGDIVEIQALDVSAEEATLKVVVQYLDRRSGERRTEAFQAGGTP